MMYRPEKHPCPCCGYLVFDEAGLYDICPICGWEDDVSQLRFATMPDGANRPSLRDGQRNYAALGYSDDRAAPHVRKPGPSDVRDPLWRLLRAEDIEVASPGVDQGQTYPATTAELYYWRPEYFRNKPATEGD
jgi:hypothetical protein